jgi:Domain of unknown function (DUF5069)
MKTPRSPYEKLAGLVFLGRTIDKIRFKAEGTLRPDFLELMGKAYDARMMSFLGLNYDEFAKFVLTGASDEQCVGYVKQHGRALNEDLIVIWNDFACKRGHNDTATERLEAFKAQDGLTHRKDVTTMFEYMEVDEGRKP